jgi:hypothetical protein
VKSARHGKIEPHKTQDKTTYLTRAGARKNRRAGVAGWSGG